MDTDSRFNVGHATPKSLLSLCDDGCLRSASGCLGSTTQDGKFSKVFREKRAGIQLPASISCAFQRVCGLLLLSIWVLMLLRGPVSGQEQGPGTGALPKGVGIEARVEPEKATVGDPVRIDFDISLPEGYRVRFPALAGPVGDFSILQTYPGPSIPDLSATPGSGADRKSPSPREGEPPHYYARILVALYKPGDYTFPPITIALKDPSGREIPLVSPAVKVRIESVLTGKDDALRDLKKQADMAEPVRWLFWMGIALLVLVLAGVVWWLWRRRHPSAAPQPQPKVDPLLLAESELRDLLSRGLLEKNLIKQFYVMLSEIIKKALEAGYGIQTVEKTTSEIMEELRSSMQPGKEGEDTGHIEFLLVACDLVKFARNKPSPFENDTVVKTAFEILGACRKRRLIPTPSNSTQAAGVN